MMNCWEKSGIRWTRQFALGQFRSFHLELGRLLCNIFQVQKWALLKKRQKNILLCDSKRSSFITYFFEIQFDTATLIIPSFRMTQARGCKKRFKSDLLRNYLVPDRIYTNAHHYGAAGR